MCFTFGLSIFKTQCTYLWLGGTVDTCTWYFILTQVRCHLLKDSDKRNIRDGQCTFINGCHSSTAPAITCPRHSQVNQSAGLKTSKLLLFIWISLIWGATFRLRWQLRVMIDWVRRRHWETLSSLTLAQILVAWGRSDLDSQVLCDQTSIQTVVNYWKTIYMYYYIGEL